MYAKPYYGKSLIRTKKQTEGESIELKVRRLIENKEPIKDGSPIIYTDRADGVNPAHNIRTDRFELATEAMDKIHRSKLAKTDGTGKKYDNTEAKVIKLNKDGEAEPTAGKAESK